VARLFGGNASLTSKVGSLAARVSVIDQQQHALNLALICLEQGMPSGESHANTGSLGTSSGSDRVVGDLCAGGDGGLCAIGSNGLHGSGGGALCVMTACA
jgi:hypothetical protein